MGVLFPNAISKMLDGPVRPMWALSSVTRPDDISDIINMVSPYTAKAGWNNFGATTDASSYDRDMSSEEYTIEQETGAVFEKITEVNRSFTIPIAEITPEHMQMLEEGGSIQNVAAAAGIGSQKRVGFGGVESLTRRRVAFIARRDPGFGQTVIEPGGAVRGPFVALIGYLCTIAPEGSGIEIAKGTLVSRQVSFNMFPDEAITNSNENTGCFLFEDGNQTIT